jgi:hypothetical protein
MPHFKCVACKTRLYSAAVPADLVGDLCPGCGSPLEPVGELAEIVGFQLTRQRDSAAVDSPPSGHRPIVGRVDALYARRDALLAQARLDAAEAIALPIPEKNP